MKAVSLRVSPEDKSCLLQDFLARHLTLSRKGAKALIDRRDVFVNGRRVWMARHPLRAGDRVEAWVAQNAPDRETASRIPILYEDQEYLVADKPAGLLTNGPDSLEVRLRTQTGNERLCAVHRLDRDTSGCVLFAKDQTAFEAMIPLFRQRAIEKKYQAVVAGEFRPREQTVTLPLDGEPAVTHIRVMQATAGASRLLIRIDTGRTHQIRRHLSALKHIVLGDRNYGTRAEVRPEWRSIERHLLHAVSLAAPNPFSGRAIRAEAPLPDDMRQWIKRLKLA